MDFLEKLNSLMAKNGLNKSTLSKACNIPYTTIDGWYKKGYEGLKLTTLKKLASYFGTTLDFWAGNETTLEPDELDLIKKYRCLDFYGKKIINQVAAVEHERCSIEKTKNNNSKAAQCISISENDNKSDIAILSDNAF